MRTIFAAQLKKHDKLDEKTRFACNLSASFLATIVSAPYNYIRTIHYETPANQKPPSDTVILRGLLKEAQAKIAECKTAIKAQRAAETAPISNVDKSTLKIPSINRFPFFIGLRHLQERLRIGPGTVRVGVGMAVGQRVYDEFSSLMKK